MDRLDGIMGIFIVILLQILLGYTLKTSINIDNSIIFVVINFFALILWALLNKKMTNNQKKILLIAIFIRFIVLFVNHYYPLSFAHNGKDAEAFDVTATNIALDLGLLKENVYGGIYSKIIGVLYYLIGNNRFYMESLNCIFSIFAIYNIFVIFNKLSLKENKKSNLLYYILVLFPQGILYSISLRREALIVLLISISLKYCLQYIQNGKKNNCILCFASLLFAAMLHAGVVFIIFGYILLISFYDKKKQKIIFNSKKVIIFSLLLIALSLIYVKYGNVIMPKISSIDSEKIINTFERQSSGGSAYLGGKEINSIKDIIIYTIPKFIYFICSPMIWDSRGLNDLISILFDALIYIYLFYNIFKYRKKLNGKNRAVLNSLLIGVLVAILAFSIGTSNAGTAIRHRYKFFNYIILLCLIVNCSQNYENKEYMEVIENGKN